MSDLFVTSEEAPYPWVYLLDFIITWQQPQTSNKINRLDITWIFRKFSTTLVGVSLSQNVIVVVDCVALVILTA